MDLVIVESPTKAKTLTKFLGGKYKIEASMGHVRDLPEKGGGLAIDVEHDFEPKYEVLSSKKANVANLKRLAKEKYLRRDDDGEVLETVGEMFERTAKFLASAEKPASRKAWVTKFADVMKEQRFMPGGRTLANAGSANNQLANCFVMPMPDDIEGIFESLKESSIPLAVVRHVQVRMPFDHHGERHRSVFVIQSKHWFAMI